jgi:hypothetical protein
VFRDLTEEEWKQYLWTGAPYRQTSQYRLVMEAHRSALSGNTQAAHAAFAQATKWAEETKDVQLNNYVAWLGCLDGFAQVVLPAAKSAVTFASPNDKGYYRDALGLARALTGDIPGAIADFQAYVNWTKDMENMAEIKQKREKWLDELRAGRNPFDDTATLKALLLE